MQINLSQQDIRKIILSSPGMSGLIGNMEDFQGTFAFIPENGSIRILITTEPVNEKSTKSVANSDKVVEPSPETSDTVSGAKKEQAVATKAEEEPETKPKKSGSLFGKKIEPKAEETSQPVIEEASVSEIGDTSLVSSDDSLAMETAQVEQLELSGLEAESVESEPVVENVEKPVRKSLFAGINKKD